MLNYFRIASVLEGISYLLILCVTLSIISREYVSFLGMAHGVLFIVYFMLSLSVSHKQSWPIVLWLSILVAAFIPFAFLLVEFFLKKQIQNNLVNEKQTHCH